MNQILTLALILFQSCSTHQRLIIKSLPEGAKVSVENTAGEEKELGVTPLEMSLSDFYARNSRMNVIRVEKEGFQSQRMFLAKGNPYENFEIRFKLQENKFDPKILDINSGQEKLAKYLAQISNLINSKRFDEGERLLHLMVTEYPHISVGYDLLGNINYLRRDFKTAMSYYRKSLDLNPQNVETKKILDRIKEMIN